MTEPDVLDRLAELCGIEPGYYDISGNLHQVPRETTVAILGAMRFPVGDATALHRALDDQVGHRWLRPIRQVEVAREDELFRIDLSLPEQEAASRYAWRLIEEGGRESSGELRPSDLERVEARQIDGTTYERRLLSLPGPPAPGYHRLELSGPEAGGETTVSCRLIVTPASCFLPAAVRGGRTWGITAQLYGLRSERNWGIGDLTDLRCLVDLCAAIGADAISLNPLHALFPHNPHHISPYSPSSRLFKNIATIDIEAIPEFHECPKAREKVASPGFQQRLEELRGTKLVDYPGAIEAKRGILEILYRHFRSNHLEAGSGRGLWFRRYQEREGLALRNHALFEALQEHFHGRDPRVWGWQVWPVPYRHPATPEVAEFADTHVERVEFYQYLQWQVETQLEEAGRRSSEQRLGVGLCEDLAVGVDPAGAEAWAHQEMFALGMGVGAPPDPFNPAGQDWGVPPFVPVRLQESGYALFIELLRRNMRHAGALRIDHILGLMRQYWVPAGTPPSEGAYVRFPFEDLLGIVALESQRNNCLIIGEDLGTVPEGLREALMARGVLSYRVFYFESDERGNARSTDSYPEQAAVAISTHDLPTLAGFWQGTDLAIRDRLGLYADDQSRNEQVVARARDRARFLLALEREGLIPEGLSVDPASIPEMTPELAIAFHAFVARTPAKLLLVQLADLVGETDPVNFPGITEGYPNWRQKLRLSLDELPEDEVVRALASRLNVERPRIRPPHPGAPGSPNPDIPLATYRLQLNRDFTFADALKIVPFLHDLGISHCYTSPYLRARPGSLHGYDIVDHNSINPEIGGREGHDRFVEVLHEHGMGLIIDLVPNHMGIGGTENAWWLDLLENGQTSSYAPFFDIDWRPMKEALRGKILLPVLREPYGQALLAGRLRLQFEPDAGTFRVDYHEDSFPIDPQTYRMILDPAASRLQAMLGDDDPDLLALQSLIAGFGHLPSRVVTSREAIQERLRDKEVHKRSLAALCRRNAAIHEQIEGTVGVFNEGEDRENGRERLHDLLESQAYRLAFWRVAADEINYRRFFDINDLAGLRMENPGVFEATHRLILDLVAQGKVNGIRLDHPDGLYDPRGYCQRLQSRVADVLHLPAPRDRDGRFERPLYLTVEKILAPYEHLRDGWPVHGTTGYDFCNLLNGLFVHAPAESRIDRVYARFTDRTIDFGELLYECKKLIIRTALASELNVLANLLDGISESSRDTRDFTRIALRDALVELVACFPVYRTYVTEDGAADEDRRYIDWAVARAKKRSPASDLTIFDFIRRILLLGSRFAMKFQQYTAPVMAKGLEDTAFYRYHRLISLNEVGGDPTRFGTSIAALHQANQERVRRWPHTMLSSSTHDSKRSEDVRSRINVLSELPEEWQKHLFLWGRLNRSKKPVVDDRPAPDRNDEYLLYQTLLGAWPLGDLDEERLDEFRLRIESYMLKAIREAKIHTSWINPNADYEEGVQHFIRRILTLSRRSRFLDDFLPFQKRISRLGMFNSLSQTLIKLVAPGVPDTYQGSTIWDYSLADPDNRRPVDYARRHSLLRDLIERSSGADVQRDAMARGLLDEMEDGCIKQYLIRRTLELRSIQHDLFRDGGYRSLDAAGKRVENLFAFARRYRNETVVAIAPRFFSKLCEAGDGLPLGGRVWEETWIELPLDWPIDRFVNHLTGEVVPVAGRGGMPAIDAAVLFRSFPVALLVPAPSAALTEIRP